MLFIKINILYIFLLSAIVEIQSLLELSTEEDNNIKIAETIIRNTVNKIFTRFKIQESNQQYKLKQLFTIHDFFVSITLKDCDNLKEIVRLSRVNDIDNILHLITQINEVLNESDKSSETNGSDILVTKHIDWFIGKLKYLKDKYDTNKKNDIEAKILSYADNNRINLENQSEYKNSPEIKVGMEEDGVNETTSNFTEYWMPSGRRIYKGFRTRIKHYPFMASVQFFKKFQCAGSIIKDDLVITSASCLQLSWNNRFFRENPAFLSVQIGSDFYEHGGENIDVQEIYFHPGYDPKTLRHNLALMRLSRRIAFKKKHKRVRKIDIDRNPYPLSGYDHITVVGWGARDSSNIIYNVLQNRLAYADLDFYPLDECREHYSRPFVTRQNFCAGFFSKGSGACNRDAGGPAIVGYKLMGVISFGAAICGSPDSPTVFTKLGYYTDWIEEIMEQDVPSVRKRTTLRLPDMIDDLDEDRVFKTTRIRFTPVILPTSSRKPIYINDLYRMAQKESTNNIISSQEIGEQLEKNNSKLNENKLTTLETFAQTEVTMKNSQITQKINKTQEELRQRQSNSDESIYDSVGMSIEADNDITTQATINITKEVNNEEDNNVSIDTTSEFVDGNPAGINEVTQERLKKDDSSYDSTETDTESFKQSPTEFTIKSPQQQVNVDDENLNKGSTKTVHSTNTTPNYKFTLLQFYEVKGDNVKHNIKHTKTRNAKEKKTKISKAPVKQKLKTTTSETTLASLNKPVVQGKYRLNRQFDEFRGNDESIETDAESVNSHSTEVEKELLDEQFNAHVGNDLIKRFVKQILNITINKKQKSEAKVIKKLRITTTASNVVKSSVPSESIKPYTNELKKRQFKEDRSNEMEAVTKSVQKYHTALKKITQEQLNLSISDDIIKKYIMQYIKENIPTRKDHVQSKRISILSTNRLTTKVMNTLKQKPFIEDNKDIIEIETGSSNDKLIHQEAKVGGSHSILNINKKQALRMPQKKEKVTIKKVQIKPKLKTTTTMTTLVLHESTAHTKNILKQSQFDTDTESLKDKVKQQRFNADGRHSRLIETDMESIKAIPNLEKGVNVRDIKDDIMALIDNLDIEELLDEVDSRNETVRAEELNDTKKDTINLKQWISLKYFFSSDEDDTALSLPVESSIRANSSLTDPRHSSTEVIEYNKIPKPIFLDLVALAVEEELKRKAGVSKTIVTDDI